MGDPLVYDLGTVTDKDGYSLTVGVHHGTVLITGISGPVARLATEQADEFTTLLVRATDEAARTQEDSNG